MAGVVLDGAPNFRDLGGYTTGDGRRVRHGQLFRSGVLSDVTDADIERLTGIGMKTVVDLRSPGEIAERPNRLPPGAIAVEVPVTDVSMSPKSWAERIAAGASEGMGAEMLLTGNRAFARELRAAFGRVLALAMDATHRPIVFHCTAGKDRTGFASALVLLSLGVPVDAVVDDYLESNARLAARHQQFLTQMRETMGDLEPLRELLEVRREYLEAGLDAILDDYGSVDAYLRDALGVTDDAKARFREDVLEPGTA
jgi:protein-tyrosine phosphatase